MIMILTLKVVINIMMRRRKKQQQKKKIYRKHVESGIIFRLTDYRYRLFSITTSIMQPTNHSLIVWFRTCKDIPKASLELT